MSRPAWSGAIARPRSLPATPAPLAAAALLSLSLGLCASPASAQAVPDAAAPAVAATGATTAPQVVAVTATRTPQKIADTVADVTVLTREDLSRMTGLTLSQALATQGGLQVSSTGGLGHSSDVFVRGMDANTTLLLVDGVRVGSATLGLASFDNLPVALIDHIEIVQGPLCAIYGADAAGGVVQVFTRRGGAGTEGRADLSAGSLGFFQAQAGVSAGGNGFDLAADGAHTQVRGFSATNPHEPFGSFDPDRDGFSQDAGSVRAGWQASPDWRLEALALQSAGLVHYDDGPGADARARLRNGVQALTLDGRVAAGWRTTLRASRSQDDYDTVASASPYAELGTISTTERRLTWENALDAGAAGTAVGVVEHVSQDVAKPGTGYDVDSRTIDSAALALNGAAGPHAWQASIRRDRNSQFGRQTTGGLGYALHLGAAWQLGASYGTSFVAPSFNQLYYPGYGNPGLQPERGHATELHARWADGDQSLRLTGFRQRMRGYITTGENPVNVDRASIDGLTLAWERQWSAVSASLALDHLTPRNDTDGTTLIRRARNDAKAAVDWRLDDRSSVGATWTAYSARRDVGGYDASFAPTYVTLGAYATLDLRADWRLARAWSMGVRLNNVTGKVYETAYGYNQPRREGYVVLSWRPR